MSELNRESDPVAHAACILLALQKMIFLKIISGLFFSFYYSINDKQFTKNVLFNYLNDDGGTNFFQVYAQLLAKLSTKIKTTIGLHQYKFLLNDATTLEPRWALHIENKWGGVFSTGVGVHSRLEPVSVYLFKRYASNGSFTQPNKNINPGTAFHYVASYEQKINDNKR